MRFTKINYRSWKSLAAVRKRHICTSKHAEHAGVGYISQRDMALTQFGFIGYSFEQNFYLQFHNI